MAVNHIFPIESPWLQDRQLPSVSKDISIIVSNDSVISLSLLFQAAVSYAAKDLNVTVICQKQLTTLPKCVHGMPKPDAKTLSTLKFVYLETADELIGYCATIHTKTVLPEILIVADVQSYFNEGLSATSEHTAAKLLALLLDCFQFISSKKQNDNCALILSCLDSFKWMNSVSLKFGFQVMKLVTTANVNTLEWKSANIVYCANFTSDKEQLFLKEVSAHK